MLGYRLIMAVGHVALFIVLACLALSAPVMAQDPTPLVVDDDHDGLIEIYTLNDLNNIRHNLAGTSSKTVSTEGDGNTAGCPTHDHDEDDRTPDVELCHGYELMADLDFDANGNGPDESDPYWGEGRGWFPIGDDDSPFTADFNGNHHTIKNLFIDRSGFDGIGLFGVIAKDTREITIKNLGLIGVNVTGGDRVGGLAGRIEPNMDMDNVFVTVDDIFVTAIYVTGTVSGDNAAITVGGLSGACHCRITASYVAAMVSGNRSLGGLVGGLVGTIEASYAVATVVSNSPFPRFIGGLAGSSSVGSAGNIDASYAVATVVADEGILVGGLVGEALSPITDSYFDAISGFSDAEQGKTSSELQSPTAYGTGEDIYANWNVDTDRDEADDNPWRFGTAQQYPGLAFPKLSSAFECPTDVSAHILVESTDDHCIHRPSAFVAKLGLEPADDTGDSAADRFTNKVNPTLTGQATVLGGNVRVVSVPGPGTTVVTTDSANGAFTAPLGLNEGLNRFEFYAQPIDAADYLGPLFSRLEVTLDTQAPRAMLFKDFSNAFSARVAEDDATLRYEQLAASDRATCIEGFSGTSLIDYREGTLLPALTGGAVYCFIATDLAGNRVVLSSANAQLAVDIDSDGLIEIRTLADLNNIRHNLAGTSSKISSEMETGSMNGCPTEDFPFDPDGRDSTDNNITACYGYELMANLNFDTDGNGRTDVAGDAYWNGGAGWEPIGTAALPYDAVFEGNGHTIANLFISRSTEVNVGLFGSLSGDDVHVSLANRNSANQIRNLGLVKAFVTGGNNVGSLVGSAEGHIITVYSVSTVSGTTNVGGLAGSVNAEVEASYAVSDVAGANQVGGLVGHSAGNITASYAVGLVAGANQVGGLVGSSSGVIDASYFDTISGLSDADQGKSSNELQTPISHSEIYADWLGIPLTNIFSYDPWDFGDATSYPGLVFPKSAAAVCPTVASADIMIETANRECVHRPTPLFVGEFKLVAADDTGRFSTDRITNKTMVRFTGLATLQSHRDIRIDSVVTGDTVAEIIHDGSQASTNVFTTADAVNLNGQGRLGFRVFARHTGETKYRGPFDELQLTLDTISPTLSIRRSTTQVIVTTEDTASIMYGLFLSEDRADCHINFDADLVYDADTGISLTENPPPEYCVVASDVAGNKAALSTLDAMETLRLKVRVFLESALP